MMNYRRSFDCIVVSSAHRDDEISLSAEVKQVEHFACVEVGLWLDLYGHVLIMCDMVMNLDSPTIECD